MPLLVARRDKTFSEIDFPKEPSCDPSDAPFKSCETWLASTASGGAPAGFVSPKDGEGALPLLSLEPSRQRRRQTTTTRGREIERGSGASVSSTTPLLGKSVIADAAAAATSVASNSQTTQKSAEDKEALLAYAKKQQKRFEGFLGKQSRVRMIRGRCDGEGGKDRTIFGLDLDTCAAAGDSDGIAVSADGKQFAVPWRAGGGGPVYVGSLAAKDRGKMRSEGPKTLL